MKKRDKKFGLTYFDLIESEILENDKKINELVDSHSQTRDNLVTLIEKKHVLLKAEELIRTNYDFSQFSEVDPGEDGIKQGMGSDLSFMAGVINIENELKMKRMIFRASRGRALPTFFDLTIEDKLTQQKIEKKIFTIFVQGGAENYLGKKIIQICDIFGASRFTIPKKEDLQNNTESRSAAKRKKNYDGLNDYIEFVEKEGASDKYDWKDETFLIELV